MTKNEMRAKLLLHDGVGVEIKDGDNTYYYFYENFETSDGRTRAGRHFRKNENVIFYEPSWAKQSQFEEYMALYNKMVCAVTTANAEYEQCPEDRQLEKKFEEAKKRQENYLEILCKQLMKWAGCCYESAKEQIMENKVDYKAFLKLNRKDAV